MPWKNRMVPRSRAVWRFPRVQSWAILMSIVVGCHRGSSEVVQSISSIGGRVGDLQSTALLLTLPDGLAGEDNLLEWATYVQSEVIELPPIWVVCPSSSPVTALVQNLAPHLRPFVVDDDASWGLVLRDFLHKATPATIFGLLGEGSLPPIHLASSVAAVDQALAGSTAPTVVISRSQTKLNAEHPRQWLPDSFVTQVWCNYFLMTGLGLEDKSVRTFPLIALLPTMIEAQSTGSDGVEGLILVDGTEMVEAVFESYAEYGRQLEVLGNTVIANEGRLAFGKLERALVGRERYTQEGPISTVSIGIAPWPPSYVLRHVATNDGLVLVNSVNCGYLDMATNFLRAAQKVAADTKVLWVATDEVAFGFMDTLAPGSVAMYPSEKSARHHAVSAGTFGDGTFTSETIIRPSIILHIVNQGYVALWTDSDMVWLDNPLTVLPDMHDPEAAELMVQMDSPGNRCTCLLFMKPTANIKKLLERWMRSIIESDAYQDQIAFQDPLREGEAEGLRVEIFPADRFPSGKQFFKHPYEEDYAHVHFENIVVVHNNWIKGHDQKRHRFEEYHLWDVGDSVGFFPSCT